jgi:hypothetical protein
LYEEDDAKDVMTLYEYKKATGQWRIQVIIKQRFANKVEKTLAYLEKNGLIKLLLSSFKKLIAGSNC